MRRHRAPLDICVLAIQGRLNGELRQNGSTALMIHHVNELISVISHGLTLPPGDVIMTGTPAESAKCKQETASKSPSKA